MNKPNNPAQGNIMTNAPQHDLLARQSTLREMFRRTQDEMNYREMLRDYDAADVAWKQMTDIEQELELIHAVTQH
jgi:transposase-like protein